jgi:hypothetical protein
MPSRLVTPGRKFSIRTSGDDAAEVEDADALQNSGTVAHRSFCGVFRLVGIRLRYKHKAFRQDTPPRRMECWELKMSHKLKR